MGFDKSIIEEGGYGFNVLLVGLGLGLYYQFNLPFVVILVIGSIATLFITIALSGFLYKYNLPYLSLPFVFGIWSMLLASRSFEAIGLNEKGIFLLNELYAKGDTWLISLYQWFDQTVVPEPILIYLKSLGAILFQ